MTDVFGGVGRYFPPTVERYGAPTIAENAAHTGVVITYEATYNGTPNSWSATTPSGVVVTGGESCWTGGGGGYGPSTACDHFGVGTSKNPTSTTYHWLTGATPGTVIPVAVSLPAPVQVVTPAPVPNQQPMVQAIVQAPPAEGGFTFGMPEWVKVFTTQYDHPVALEDLVGGKKGLAPQNPSETEVEWQFLQSEAGNPNAGLLESPDQQAGNGAESVLRRYEFYKYLDPMNCGPSGTGSCIDPATGEMIGSDTAFASGPGTNVGAFIGDQNLGVNLNGVYAGPPASVIPEPSTWAMIFLGFAGLRFAGVRASHKTAASEA